MCFCCNVKKYIIRVLFGGFNSVYFRFVLVFLTQIHQTGPECPTAGAPPPRGCAHVQAQGVRATAGHVYILCFFCCVFVSVVLFVNCAGFLSPTFFVVFF